jgi:hypothetical protein
VAKDKVKTTQIDKSRAQLFIAERRTQKQSPQPETQREGLRKAGKCFWAEAVITRGIALARLKQTEEARFLFQTAIEVAPQAGALNRAGRLKVRRLASPIEEIRLPKWLGE